MRLGDAFDLQMGKTPSRDNSSYWNNGDHEWVSIKDLGTYGKYVGSTKETISELGRAESGIKPVPANTLIMSFKLSLGKTAITTRETYTNEAIMAFLEKGDHEINLDYMWHQFRSKDWTVGTNTAVMGKTLNKKTLGDSTIRIPSLAEQIEIADILDKVLRQIDATNNQVFHLQSLVKSQFVEMFGDPVDNPHNWPVEKLSTLGNLKNGINFRSTESGQEIPCLGVSDFKNRSRIDDMSLISRIRIDNELGDSQVLKDGDVIFVRSNGNKQLVGRCLAIFPKSQKVTFSGFCIRFRSTSNKTNLEYLLSTLKTSSMRSAMMGRGANIQNLNQKILANLEIPIPPLELQREFAAFARQAAKLEFVAPVQYNNQCRFQFNEGRSHDNRRDKEQGR